MTKITAILPLHSLLYYRNEVVDTATRGRDRKKVTITYGKHHIRTTVDVDDLMLLPGEGGNINTLA